MVERTHDENDPVTVADFRKLRSEWEAWKVAQALRWDVTSVNDIASTSPTERLVTFTDSQRVLMKAVIVNQETRNLLGAVNEGRGRFVDSWLGRISLAFGLVVGIVVILSSVFQDLYGLSHSILSH